MNMKSRRQAKQHRYLSDIRLPEDVLKKFVGDLKVPVDVVEKSLRGLPKRAALDNEDVFSRLGQAVQSINENIRLVIDYLHMRLKDGFAESEEKIVFEVLGQFSHMLRERSVPLMGYVSVCQQCKLSEDEFARNMETIKHYGEQLVKVFKALENNWQFWLETKSFDWRASDL